MENKDKLLSELKALEGKIAERVQDYHAMSTKDASALASLEAKYEAATLELKELSASIVDLEKKFGRPQMGNRSEIKVISSSFLNSPQFKQFVEMKAAHSAPVNLGALRQYAGWETKGVAGNDALRGVLSTNLMQGIVSDPMRKARVRDLFPVYSTEQSLIEYIRESVLNINASMVAEGLQKPESNIKFEDASTAIRTLAHWIGVPRQLLADIKSLGQYLEGRLLTGLKMVEDTQILYGDGVGQNLTGILTSPGIQTYTWSDGYGATTSYGGDTALDAIRRAVTLAELAEYPVDGIVMHPKDWEQIELLKSTEGLYIWVNVTTGGQKNLFAIPVVTTTAINKGTVLIGAFGMGAAIWDRESASMRVSESHGNMFTENMVAMLIEERLGVTVIREKSFIKVTLDQAPSANHVPG